jgi:peptidoglycan/LPS O-acetylase OafA/YrhL
MQTSAAAEATAAPTPADDRPRRSEALRHDIQALRAIAVASVVLFHLWPERLPGGYVGVDVFFVISGFLITSHLLREIDRTGSIRLSAFWARRAKRLLPAALIVALVTALATILVVPASRWSQFLGETISSTWYVENWSLANKAVDYLAADAPPSPVQHFWSLSVEEQFYLGMPLLLLAAVAVAVLRIGSWRRAVLMVLGLVTVVSFGYGVWLTATSAPTAYFSTFTRAWEFGAGALVALVPGMPRGRASRVFAWAGMAAIVVTCVLYTPQVSFPGYAAALPVVATALVILARDRDGRGSVGHVGSLAVPSFLGRSSYSIYLWHWPLIVLLPFVTGAELDGRTKLLVIAASLLLAHGMTRFVEEPVRFSPRLLGGTRSPRLVGGVSAVAMLVVTAVAWSALNVNETRATQLAQASTAIVASKPSCLGAAARAPHVTGCPDPKLAGVLVPDPSTAATDDANRVDCWSGAAESVLRVCTLGPTSGFSRRLFAVGDSHSNALLSAYEVIAREHNWRIDVAGHNGCYWTAAHQVKTTDAYTAACAAWVTKLTGYLGSHTGYDAILTTYAYGRSLVVADAGSSMADTTVRGLEAAWRPVIAAGTPVFAINDVPAMREDVVTCVEKYRLDAASACSSPRTQALAAFNGLAPAVAATPGSALIDLTSYFCDARTCLPVIGHVAVYRDHDHITATFARTLGPFLGQAIAARLRH